MLKSKRFILIAVMSIITTLLISCTGHPNGLDNPRQLTEAEKAKAIEVAFSTSEVQKQLETKAHYTAEIHWVAITWSGSKWSAYYHIDKN